MTFLRPKPGQSPTTATFEVPLTFNKFDFRDYLFHLYNVEVTSVRSFINQRMPAQRSIAGTVGGQWYRPRAQKLMMVDLVKPFTWPERPAEADMEAWDHKLFKAVEAGHEEDVAVAEANSSWGPQPLRTDKKVPRERRELRKLAISLLSGKQRWAPGVEELVAVEPPKIRQLAPPAVPATASDSAAAAVTQKADAKKNPELVTESAEESHGDLTEVEQELNIKDERRP